MCAELVPFKFQAFSEPIGEREALAQETLPWSKAFAWHRYLVIDAASFQDRKEAGSQVILDANSRSQVVKRPGPVGVDFRTKALG